MARMKLHIQTDLQLQLLHINHIASPHIQNYSTCDFGGIFYIPNLLYARDFDRQYR